MQFLKRYSNAKRRTPDYSQALRRVQKGRLENIQWNSDSR